MVPGEAYARALACGRGSLDWGVWIKARRGAGKSWRQERLWQGSVAGAYMWLRSVLLPTSVTYGMALPWNVRRTSLNQSSRFWKLW